MAKKKLPEIIITELFMAKAGIGMKGFDRCFYGTIKREKDDNGNEYLVRGRIHVKNNIHDGYIYALGKDQWELGEKLDELVLLIIDKGLHSGAGFNQKICDMDFNLN